MKVALLTLVERANLVTSALVAVTAAKLIVEVARLTPSTRANVIVLASFVTAVHYTQKTNAAAPVKTYTVDPASLLPIMAASVTVREWIAMEAILKMTAAAIVPQLTVD